MEVRATYRYAKISPFKAREITREIQGLPVSAAQLAALSTAPFARPRVQDRDDVMTPNDLDAEVFVIGLLLRRDDRNPHRSNASG